MFDAEKFIYAIQPRRAIWDKNSSDYMNKTLKAKAWDEVGEEMFPDWTELSLEDKCDKEKDLQKKWKNITDSFRKELKLIKRQSQGEPAKKRRRYIFFNILQFLKPTLKTRRRCYNLKTEEDITDLSSLDVDAKHPLESMKEVVESKIMKSSTSKNVETKKNNRDINSFDHDLIDVFREDSNDKCVSKCDSDKLFLLSLIPMFNKMTEDQNITARIEIMQLLHGILYSQRL